MHDFGTTANHSNASLYGDIDSMNNPSGGYSAHVWTRIRTSPGGDNQARMFGKGDWSPGTSGWYFYPDASGNLKIAHGNGAFSPATPSTGALGTTLVQGAGVAWAGTATTTLKYYIDGSLDSSTTFSGNPLSNTDQVAFGGNQDGSGGLASYMGQVMWWNTFLADADFTVLGNKLVVPKFSSLGFWVKAISVPHSDSITGAAGTSRGTVNKFAHEADSYYSTSGTLVLFVAHWVAPLIHASVFGYNLMHENMDKMLPVMRKIMGCQFFSNDGDWEFIIRKVEKGLTKQVYLGAA